MEKPFPNVAAEYHFELLKARKKKFAEKCERFPSCSNKFFKKLLNSDTLRKKKYKLNIIICFPFELIQLVCTLCANISVRN